MPPSQIIVLRHAEKPDDLDDPGLSAAGRARAERLAAWLPAALGWPDAIFATAVSRHSARPLQTVEPLARAVGVAVDASYADQDYEALARAIRSGHAGQRVVVCWHHGNIPGLMHALGAPDGAYPDPWPRASFDIVLVLAAGGVVRMTY